MGAKAGEGMRAETVAAVIDRPAERIERLAVGVLRWSNQHPVVS